ncbi:hypothetical protein L915_08219 [Phytophthora nicotianae]|uniref:Uncharacterized protein n=1 Tax=Phytophthora nicotianae TaxID=4792 RepID=W2GYA5_PHYNI|nr:hypothetical protein L915_08219 [Phytophthora nicotianae]ETL40743.1 hypothetical protein L916_08143 [Phytophthora nicotianae]
MMTANRGHAAAKDMLRLIVAKQLTSIDGSNCSSLSV